MIQFSVYMRICKGLSSAKSSINAVKRYLPPYGNVRVLIITEKQFDNMEILLGGTNFNKKINNDKNFVLFEFDEKMGDYRYNTTPQTQEPNKKKDGISKKEKIRQPRLIEF